MFFGMLHFNMVMDMYSRQSFAHWNVMSQSVFSFFLLPRFHSLVVCEYVCVSCDYNTYYKCNNGRPAR